MIFAIDAGNTNVVLGLIEDDRVIHHFRISTDTGKTEDEYFITFTQIMQAYKVDVSKIDGVIICSVVPPVTRMLENAAYKLTGIKGKIVNYKMNTGLEISIDNPAQLGNDLIADAVGAADKYPLPLIVFDLGTANTISVIDSSKRYLGGVIMPGLRLSLNALSSNTSQLPKVSIDTPPGCIGKNTIDCMKSGSIFGTAAMMDGMILRIEEELGEKATVVATGGLAPLVAPNCKREILLDDNLMLHGLNILYKNN